MPEKKKAIPKYRLNYLMKRIEEEGQLKVRALNVDIETESCAKQDAIKDMQPKDMTSMEMLLGVWRSSTEMEIKASRNKLRKRNKKRPHSGYGAPSATEPSAYDILMDLTGEERRIERLGKKLEAIQEKTWPERQKRTKAINDYVRNIKDEYYLGHDIDLVNTLESFKKKKF